MSLAASEGILNLPHRSEVLPNGLKLYMIRYPSPGAVAYHIAVHVGSRNEPEKGKTGFAHFFEHLMFRGTKTRSATEFANLYVKLGCENNAYTSYDITAYHGSVASTYLPRILAAEADRFINLSFPEKTLRDEAGAVLGEYNKDVAQPEFMMEEKLMSTAFRIHPYSHTTMGFKEDILQFTERYQDVWPFFKRYYRPENVSVILIGDFDFDSIFKTVKQYFSPWKNPELSPLPIPQEPVQTEARQAAIQLNKPTQTRIDIAYKVPPFTTRNPDTAALELWSEMLFSTTSDFQKEYRFHRKWLDSVSTEGTEWADPGIWTIHLRLAAEGEGKEKEILAAVDRTLERARTNAPPPKRLTQTQTRFKNAMLLGWFGSPDSLAQTVAHYTNLESDLGVLDRFFKSIVKVTPSDLEQFAIRHFVEKNKTTVILKGAS